MTPTKTRPATGLPADAAGGGPSASPSPDINRPVKRIVAQNAKVLYFTFDDGPSTQWTPKVLAVLAKHHAHATFFPLGDEVKKNPDLIEQERAAGHTIGNYTYERNDLTKVSSDQARKELQTSTQSRCIRPPFGSVNQQVRDIASDLNLRIVLWDVDPQDWAQPGVKVIVKRVLDQLTNEAIILMHDGGGKRAQTIPALDQLLTKLAAQGFTFASLDC